MDPVSAVVKNLPAKAGDVRDSSSIPGLGGPPGLEMATHSSILAWRIPIDREAWWATVPRAAKESDVTLSEGHPPPSRHTGLCVI